MKAYAPDAAPYKGEAPTDSKERHVFQNDGFIKIAQGSLEIQKKYMELSKKWECTSPVKAYEVDVVLCKGYGAMFKEMSNMCGKFAIAK